MRRCASASRCAAREEFRTAVDQVRQPFFCNVAAQAAAVEALRHQDEVARRVERAVAGRMRARRRACAAWASSVAESQANFSGSTCPRTPTRPRSCAALTERGVLVRAGGALGRDGALRVTYGTAGENDRFLARLAAHHL